MEAIKGPFDWTVTSFDVLQKLLNSEFDPTEILEPNNIVVSYAGSGMCEKTGLIFHHSIDRKTLRQYGFLRQGEKIIATEEINQVVNKARGRFLHTFKNLKSLQKDSGPLLFVRWRRIRHPDESFPAAFEGENERTLTSAIGRFLGHENFYVASIESHISNNRLEPFSDAVSDFHCNGKHISLSIKERKGWNGDQSNNFKGDGFSWDVGLGRVFSYLQQHNKLESPSFWARLIRG